MKHDARCTQHQNYVKQVVAGSHKEQWYCC